MASTSVYGPAATGPEGTPRWKASGSPYCPDDNRIERVWLDLHANVTRNHRCRTIEELMVQVAAFLRAYNQRKKLNPSLKLAAGVSGSRSVV